MAAWTWSQIVANACSVAKAKGMTAQAGLLCKIISEELCETYDLDAAKGIFNFNFNPGLTDTVNGQLIFGGPYPLPEDYLRAVDEDSIFWTNLGVPYPMIPIDLREFDMTVQQAGLQSYPYFCATDMSQSPPVLWVYPPPSGAYPVTVRYRRQMPMPAEPDTDNATVVWFPNTTYLTTRLAGELMRLTDDSRMDVFLGDSPAGAQGILNRYLKLKDDQGNRAEQVKMDRRRFGNPSFAALPNTKEVGF